MKQKLMALLQKAKPMAMALLAKAPLPIGICLGYVFHEEISLALDAAKLLLKLL